jgi:hypothetical protein
MSEYDQKTTGEWLLPTPKTAPILEAVRALNIAFEIWNEMSGKPMIGDPSRHYGNIADAESLLINKILYEAREYPAKNEYEPEVIEDTFDKLQIMVLITASFASDAMRAARETALLAEVEPNRGKKAYREACKRWHEKEWTYALKANFFAGYLRALWESRKRGGELAKELNTEDAIMVTEYFSKLGKAGAKKRVDPMNNLRLWAIEKYKEKDDWKSANQAAHTLKESVIKHGRTINARLTEENAQRTIAEWFRKSV